MLTRHGGSRTSVNCQCRFFSARLCLAHGWGHAGPLVAHVHACTYVHAWMHAYMRALVINAPCTCCCCGWVDTLPTQACV